MVSIKKEGGSIFFVHGHKLTMHKMLTLSTEEMYSVPMIRERGIMHND